MNTYDTPLQYETFCTRYDMYRTILTTMVNTAKMYIALYLYYGTNV